MRVMVAIILIVLIQNVLAQQSDFKISAKKPIPASDVWETTLTIIFSPILKNGLFIETPAELRLVPVSVTHDIKQFWVQNSNRIPDSDSILTWQMTESGFLLNFKADQFSDKNTLTITCITYLPVSTLPSKAEIRIHPVIDQSGKREISNQIIASKDIESLYLK